MRRPPRIWWDGYDFLVLLPTDGRDAWNKRTPPMPGVYRAEREDDIASRDGDEMAVELVPASSTDFNALIVENRRDVIRELTALRDVAEAARAVTDGRRNLDFTVGSYVDRLIDTLGAALEALDGNTDV